MEGIDQLSPEQQQALKYLTFIGDPTTILKCLQHPQIICKSYCKGCHAPICHKCVQNHHNTNSTVNIKKDPSSNLSMHKIQEIEEIAKIAFDNFTRAFLDVEKFKKEKGAYFEQRNQLYKRECRNFMTKLHKFISHFLMKTQEKILSTMD